MAAADLPVLSLADVARHSTPACCWVAIDGRVYDVTAFVEKHPGGKAVLLGVGGRDASKQVCAAVQAARPRQCVSAMAVQNVSQA